MKVMYGVSNLHVGTFETDSDGNVTLGTPMAVPGTVRITLEPDSSESVFWADNVKYWTSYNDNGFTGEIENALFDDDFKTAFLNYIELDDGGIAQSKYERNKDVYFAFQADGDTDNRRMIVYNVALGHIQREHATTEDTIEPQTATLPFTATGDNGTGITRVSYPEDNPVYDTLFTNPPVPALPSE